MFTGRYALAMDDKGRVAVPALYRAQLTKMEGVPLYLTPYDSDEGRSYVAVYPSPRFEELAEEIEAIDDADERELLMEEVLGGSIMVDFDAQGRIVLPAVLRERVGLKGRVVIEGQRRRFDIWDEATLQRRENEKQADRQRLSSALKRIRR